MSAAVPRSKSWCFTWNNYPDDWQARLKAGLEAVGASKYVYQRERGEAGTPHVQGVLQFGAQKTATAWQGAFDDALGVRPHYEVCRNWKNSAVYCCKADSAEGESFSTEARYRRVPPSDFFSVPEALPWQSDVINLAEQEPEDRHVYWLWSTYGKVGKSRLSRHLAIKYEHDPRPVLLSGGSAKDILYMVASNKKEKGTEPRMVIWDLPRSQTVPDYGGLENLKNGTFCSTKYESGMCILSRHPHIVVFANYPPDETKLSEDRWKVTRVDTEY